MPRRGQGIGAGTIRRNAEQAAAVRQRIADPKQQARQVKNEQVHSTRTDLGTGRKSSRLAEVNRVPKPARRRWQRPSTLPGIPSDAIPNHKVRYNRVDGRSRGDRRNVESRLREGWEFVRHDELPKYSLPTFSLTRYGEVIGNDDMVLMKMHEELVEQRNAEYAGRTQNQTQGVLATLREMAADKDAKLRVTNKRHVDVPKRGRNVQVREDE